MQKKVRRIPAEEIDDTREPYDDSEFIRGVAAALSIVKRVFQENDKKGRYEIAAELQAVMSKIQKLEYDNYSTMKAAHQLCDIALRQHDKKCSLCIPRNQYGEHCYNLDQAFGLISTCENDFTNEVGQSK